MVYVLLLMGQILARLFSRFGRYKNHLKLLMLGLDGAGAIQAFLSLSVCPVLLTGLVSEAEVKPY